MLPALVAAAETLEELVNVANAELMVEDVVDAATCTAVELVELAGCARPPVTEGTALILEEIGMLLDGVLQLDAAGASRILALS